MPYAPLLSESEIAEGLAALPEWQREGYTIFRTVRCPTFMAAIGLVNDVADAAEMADHHPDMLINWRRVTFTLTTHASKGLTARDLGMADTIDRLADAALPGDLAK
jgi:4a-hydroxytetrahydrobiopterin dehydratase